VPKPHPHNEMIEVRHTGNEAEVCLGGAWAVDNTNPRSRDVLAMLPPKITSIRITTATLTSWDSTLVIVLYSLIDHAEAIGASLDLSALDEGLAKLLRMATQGHDGDKRDRTPRGGFATRLGDGTLTLLNRSGDVLEFFGELTLSFGRLVRGKVNFRGSDFLEFLQGCSISPIGIITLLSLLLGMILAYIGVSLFSAYGTEILIADVVAITMMREMGAILVGVVMAGHTGAAYAAQLGTMEVNEEIDALRTFGISPMDFLVLPRVLATVIMMPLLVVFADLLGILGGGLIAMAISDLTLTQYVEETRAIFILNNFYLGIAKGALFGLIVALTGCHAGMRCKRNASAVGHAATSAVITAIIWIIIADAVSAVLCNHLGI
jgi:phospholipid/cholesterol/gamma-HCH transport system permease protein